MAQGTPPAKLVAGNWKMNGTKAEAAKLLGALVQANAGKKGVEVAVCPPYPLLAMAHEKLKGSGIVLGAQNCSAHLVGAYTGEVSALLLKDMGCSYVILGHSERREQHGESDVLIRTKIAAAHAAGLKVILCVGEKSAEMDEAQRLHIVRVQITNSLPGCATSSNTIVAYEPVWAIGSGLTPTAHQITEMHAAIGVYLPANMRGARVIYGGSVKADNAKSILHLKGVDGVLPGGASLNADSFMKIIEAAI